MFQRILEGNTPPMLGTSCQGDFFLNPDHHAEVLEQFFTFWRLTPSILQPPSLDSPSFCPFPSFLHFLVGVCGFLLPSYGGFSAFRLTRQTEVTQTSNCENYSWRVFNHHHHHHHHPHRTVTNSPMCLQHGSTDLCHYLCVCAKFMKLFKHFFLHTCCCLSASSCQTH